jgi:hypothetical protein
MQGMELLIALSSKQAEILQQLLQQLNERDAMRATLDAEREDRAVRRDAELTGALASMTREMSSLTREMSSLTREVSSLTRDMASLTHELQTRLPLARAGGGGGGGGSPSPLATPQSSGGGASSPRSSQQQRSPPHDVRLARLRDAFSAAQRTGSTFDVGGLVAPFPAQALLTRGARFAHRVAFKGLVGDGRDFGSAMEGATFMLLPPVESGKAGMSFFIPLSDAPEVLLAAHAYHGAASGCLAYPLDAMPPSMALVVDKVQVVGAGAAGAPIMLHASLSALERMPLLAFSTALESWEGRQVCLPAGAGAPDACFAGCCGHGEGAAVELDAPPEGAGGGDDATATLLKGAARALAAGLAAPPRGGAPGVWGGQSI